MRWRLDRAAACQRQALALEPRPRRGPQQSRPGPAGAGQHAEARTSYRCALALKPALADAEINLGNLLAGRGPRGRAVAHFERALALAPRSATAHFNLAERLARPGPERGGGASLPHGARPRSGPGRGPRRPRPARSCRASRSRRRSSASRRPSRSIRSMPRRPTTLVSPGSPRAIRRQRGRRSSTRSRPIPSSPRRTTTSASCSSSRASRRRRSRASAARSALDPDYVQAHSNLGHLLKEQGRLDDRSRAFLRAVEGDADHAEFDRAAGLSAAARLPSGTGSPSSGPRSTRRPGRRSPTAGGPARRRSAP